MPTSRPLPTGAVLKSAAAAGAALAFALFTVAPRAQNGPAPDDLVALGDYHLLAGDTARALAYYRAAGEADPLNPRAWSGWTRALEATDEDLLWRTLSEKAIVNPEALPDEARATLAHLAARRGARDRAASLLIPPGETASPREWLVRGYLAWERQDYAEAVKDYKEARVAGSYLATLLLGETLIFTQNYDQAELYLTEFARDYPYLPESHCALGELYFYQNEGERAAAEFEAALTYDPGCRRALIGLAALAERRGDWEDAIRRYNSLADADPRDAEALRRSADAYENLDANVARVKREEYQRRFQRPP